MIGGRLAGSIRSAVVERSFLISEYKQINITVDEEQLPAFNAGVFHIVIGRVSSHIHILVCWLIFCQHHHMAGGLVENHHFLASLIAGYDFVAVILRAFVIDGGDGKGVLGVIVIIAA